MKPYLEVNATNSRYVHSMLLSWNQQLHPHGKCGSCQSFNYCDCKVDQI